MVEDTGAVSYSEHGLDIVLFEFVSLLVRRFWPSTVRKDGCV